VYHAHVHEIAALVDAALGATADAAPGAPLGSAVALSIGDAGVEQERLVRGTVRRVPDLGPAIDEHTAEKDAKGLVAEIYQTLDHGKTDSLFSLVSDAVAVFGPRRLDASATRSDALVALNKVLDPKAKHALRTTSLTLVPSQGGHSAWLFDVVQIDGHALAVTAVLSNTDDLWSVFAVALAAQPSARTLKAESAKDAVVPPGAAAPGKVDGALDGVVAQFKKGLLDQQQWGDELASRSDAIVVGPVAGDVARGKAAIKKRWAARMKANARAALSGEVSAGRTPDAALVWLTAPVTRVADDEEPLPLRLFAVYEKDGMGYAMIALHEAVAVDEPGAGAALKKIVPPAPAPPEPEPKAADSKDAKADSADAKPAKPAAKAKAKKKPKAKAKAKPAAKPKVVPQAEREDQ